MGPSVTGLSVQAARLAESAHEIARVPTPDTSPSIASATPDARPSAPALEIAGPPLVMHELVDQRAAVAAYRANVSVLRTSDEVTQSLLDALR